MDFFDQERPQHLSRSPALAGYEDGPPPYDEYAPYDEIGTEFGGPTSTGSRRAPWDDDIRSTGGRAGAPPLGRGLLAGAVTGFLGAAVAIGVANFTAAFIGPQASPIIAAGRVFTARTPSALKHFAVESFGGNDEELLLLGLSVTIALIAMAIGMLAWRRAGIGVAGMGLFGLFEAYVAITAPGGRITDAIPSIVGGLAAIGVIVVLIRAGTRPGADGTAADESPGRESPGYESPGYGTATAYPAGWTA